MTSWGAHSVIADALCATLNASFSARGLRGLTPRERTLALPLSLLGGAYGSMERYVDAVRGKPLTVRSRLLRRTALFLPVVNTWCGVIDTHTAHAFITQVLVWVQGSIGLENSAVLERLGFLRGTPAILAAATSSTPTKTLGEYLACPDMAPTELTVAATHKALKRKAEDNALVEEQLTRATEWCPKCATKSMSTTVKRCSTGLGGKSELQSGLECVVCGFRE